MASHSAAAAAEARSAPSQSNLRPSAVEFFVEIRLVRPAVASFRSGKHQNLTYD